MHRIKSIFFLLFVLATVNITFAAKRPTFGLVELKCDNRVEPVGVDAESIKFSWKAQSSSRNYLQEAYQVDVAANLEDLLSRKNLVWSSGKVKCDESVSVEYQGSELSSSTRYFWRVRTWNNSSECSLWSAASSFVTDISELEWGDAEWIAMEPDTLFARVVRGVDAPLQWKQLGQTKVGGFKLPLFRKVFSVSDKELDNAVMFLSGLGHFDAYINGQRVGENFLDPGWTEYDKVAQYVGFDVTDMLTGGDNAIGVMLGNGFYNIPRQRYFKLLVSYGAPKMICTIKLTYSDGSVEYVKSDTSWLSTQSPIRYSSIYGGEDYDAREYQEGWCEVGFDDSKWGASHLAEFSADLALQTAPPLAVREELIPLRKFKNEAGNWVYDLGQNFSGIIDIKVQGESGAKIRFSPAELLNPDQTINQSASGRPFFFDYTLIGDQQGESWRPQFTYYGFRYVEVEGAVPASEEESDLPKIISLNGLHTTSSAEEVGHFSCSNSMFNDIYNLIDWSVRSNLASLLTDCPHREKLGWLEVAHLMQYSMQYRYDLSMFYRKVVGDMADSQTLEGIIPSICPEYVRFGAGFENSPEWGSAFIIIPWQLYEWYGDTETMAKYYDQMKGYIDYLSSRADDNIVSYGLGDWFDLGPKNPGYSQLTSMGLTSTAIYYHDVVIMSKIADLLGQSKDVESFDKLASSIKKSFNEKFYNSENESYDRGSQTANAMSIYLGLVEPENQEGVLRTIATELEGRNYALTAGDVGYRYLLQTLNDNGMSDLIYKMNARYDVPGYGWQLSHGATSLTESWQAYGFVSNNHCMLGHLNEWLFAGVGGIMQEKNSVRFRDIVIDPQVVGDITSSKSTYKSQYGVIACENSVNGNIQELRVEVPANSTARVVLIGGDPSGVWESGQPLNCANGVLDFQVVDGKVNVSVGSGIYNFKVLLK